MDEKSPKRPSDIAKRTYENLIKDMIANIVRMKREAKSKDITFDPDLFIIPTTPLVSQVEPQIRRLGRSNEIQNMNNEPMVIYSDVDCGVLGVMQ